MVVLFSISIPFTAQEANVTNEIKNQGITAEAVFTDENGVGTEAITDITVVKLSARSKSNAEIYKGTVRVFDSKTQVEDDAAVFSELKAYDE